MRPIISFECSASVYSRASLNCYTVTIDHRSIIVDRKMAGATITSCSNCIAIAATIMRVTWQPPLSFS